MPQSGLDQGADRSNVKAIRTVKPWKPNDPVSGAQAIQQQPDSGVHMNHVL
jgi:hypothetical protein